MRIKIARNIESTDFASEDFFHVNNCGYYQNIDRDMNVFRPNGRNDYQAIYIRDGEIRVFDKETVKTVTGGSLILFRPHLKQVYSVKGDGHTSYFWLHFSGKCAEEILRLANITESIYNVGRFDKFVDGCGKIIREIEFNSNDACANAEAIGILAAVEKQCGNQNTRFKKVLKKMSDDIEQGINSRDYSEFSGMSSFHFIRSFKSLYGTTPHEYFIKLKIEKSKFLLTETDMKIKDISSTVGYDDQFHFSKSFKKITGVSPTHYRAAHRS